jgi:hypothetical protein
MKATGFAGGRGERRFESIEIRPPAKPVALTPKERQIRDSRGRGSQGRRLIEIEARCQQTASLFFCAHEAVVKRPTTTYNSCAQSVVVLSESRRRLPTEVGIEPESPARGDMPRRERCRPSRGLNICNAYDSPGACAPGYMISPLRGYFLIAAYAAAQMRASICYSRQPRRSLPC